MNSNHHRRLETLRDLIPLQEVLEGDHTLVFECTNCGRRSELDVGRLIQVHGPETRIGFIKRNTSCEICIPRDA